MSVRLEIHVRPQASSASVGGCHDGALVVRVVEPAHRGQATRAALRALADALEVPRRCVHLVRGTSSHKKVVEITLEGEEGDGERLAARVRQLTE